ncbi:MAG: TonB-dependent receptor [Steroidobacteraceae bacterium]
MPMRKILLGATISSLLSGTAQSWAADSGGSESAGLEEIVVTAEKRSENLQKTAISITALTGDDLRDAAKTDLNKIVESVPGVVMNGGGVNGSYAYIRGVGSTPRFTGDSSVTLTTDGIFNQRGNSSRGSFYDVARVEVLRGPQTTLTGRNAEGGSINVITNAPLLDQTVARASITAGNYGTLAGEGALNLPLADTLAVRAAFSAIKRGPYFSDDSGDEDTVSSRLRLLYQPSEAIKLILSGEYSTQGAVETGGVNSGYIDLSQPFHVVNGYYWSRSPKLSSSDYRVTNLYADFSWDWNWATLYVQPTYQRNILKSLAYTTNEATYQKALVSGYSNATAYARATSFAGGNSLSEQKTMEVRLNSPDNQRLKWLGGLYYFYNTQEQAPNSIAGSSTTTVPATALPLFPVGDYQNIYPQSPSREARDFDVFGQATWSFTDASRGTAGARWSKAERARGYAPGYYVEPDGTVINTTRSFPLDNGVAGTTTAGTATGTRGIPNNSVVYDISAASRTYYDVNYHVAFEHDFSPDSMWYASVSTGWKPGSFSFIASEDQICQVSDGCATAVPYLASGFSAFYKPEHLLAYEIGSKNTWLQNRLRVNGSVFYYNYKDYQFDYNVNPYNLDTGVDPDYTTTVTANADKAVSYGGELEASWLLTPADKFDLAVGYTHARIKELNVASTASAALKAWAAAMTDQPMPRAPDWTVAPSYAHTFALPNSAQLELSVDGQYQSTQTLILPATVVQLQHPDYYQQEPFWKFNASVGYSKPGDKWSVRAYVRNLTNKVTMEQWSIPTSFSTYGAVTFYPADPRTYGVMLSAEL